MSANPILPLTGAVIGGGRGGRSSLRGLAASSSFKLTALTDLRTEVCAELAAMYPGLSTFTDYREMFRACPVDVVCVSTYPPSHVEIALAAMESMPLKGILVEKPLSHLAADGRRLLDAIKARRLPLAVPHGLVSRSAPLEIIRLVDTGALGELRLIEIQSPIWDIINAGIHWFHLALRVAGRAAVRSVLTGCDASTRTYRDGMQVETASVTYVTLANGVRIVLQTGDDVSNNGRGGPLSAHFRFVGTKGLIEYAGWGTDFWICNAQHPHGEMISPPDAGIPHHQMHLETLPPMIASGVPDYANAEDSLAALEICEAAYRSAREHVEVFFPLAEFKTPPRATWSPGDPYAGQGGGRDGRKLGRS